MAEGTYHLSQITFSLKDNGKKKKMNYFRGIKNHCCAATRNNLEIPTIMQYCLTSKIIKLTTLCASIILSKLN